MTDRVSEQEAGSTPNDAEAAGAGLVNLDFAGSGALVVAAVAGVAAPDTFDVATVVASGLLFAVGIVAFLWGYANGVVRSREESITLGGLFFLAGTAPKIVRFRMRLALAVQIVVAVSAAAIRPYTAVAFAVLAPMFGLGLMAAWAARHGEFAPKEDGSR